MGVVELLSFDNAVFKAYVFWSAVLVIKTLAMSLLTVFAKYKKKIFFSKEELKSKKDEIKADIERVRRAHRNDLENILPFFIIALLYVLTDPSAIIAINLIRTVALSRIAHTIVYAVVIIPQPARVFFFAVALVSTAYIALQVACYAL